jgi:hypothetical protein
MRPLVFVKEVTEFTSPHLPPPTPHYRYEQTEGTVSVGSPQEIFSELLKEIVGCEGDAHRDGALDPVQGHAFVEPSPALRPVQLPNDFRHTEHRLRRGRGA